MARSPSEQPTHAELAILRVLWQRGPCRLSTVCEALSQGRKVAPTTVATLLKIMKRKGQVTRTIGPGGIRWRAALTQGRASSNYLRDLVDRVFEGSAQKLVLHLLEGGHLSVADQKEIRRILNSKTTKT